MVAILKIIYFLENFAKCKKSYHFLSETFRMHAE